jgi:hypothetical protein
LAVIAKRERGLLLETAGPHYRRLFTPEVTAADVWQRVRVLRSVDAELAAQQRALSGRSKAIAVHGNRLVAHLVFDMLRQRHLAGDAQLDAVPELTRDLLRRLTGQVEAMFPDSYITSLFKNTDKCRQLATAVLARLITGRDGDDPARPL